jgi:hypothetical protein
MSWRTRTPLTLGTRRWNCAARATTKSAPRITSSRGGGSAPTGTASVAMAGYGQSAPAWPWLVRSLPRVRWQRSSQRRVSGKAAHGRRRKAMSGREEHRRRRRSRAGDGGGGGLAAFLVLCSFLFQGRRKETGGSTWVGPCGATVPLLLESIRSCADRGYGRVLREVGTTAQI